MRIVREGVTLQNINISTYCIFRLRNTRAITERQLAEFIDFRTTSKEIFEFRAHLDERNSPRLFWPVLEDHLISGATRTRS